MKHDDVIEVSPSLVRGKDLEVSKDGTWRLLRSRTSIHAATATPSQCRQSRLRFDGALSSSTPCRFSIHTASRCIGRWLCG